MTTKPTASRWPEKVYSYNVHTEWDVLQEWDQYWFAGRSNIEYIRADLAAAREQEHSDSDYEALQQRLIDNQRTAAECQNAWMEKCAKLEYQLGLRAAREQELVDHIIRPHASNIALYEAAMKERELAIVCATLEAASKAFGLNLTPHGKRAILSIDPAKIIESLKDTK